MRILPWHIIASLLVLASACEQDEPMECDFVEMTGSFMLTGSNVCTEFVPRTRTKLEDYSAWEVIGVEDWYVKDISLTCVFARRFKSV